MLLSHVAGQFGASNRTDINGVNLSVVLAYVVAAPILETFLFQTLPVMVARKFHAGFWVQYFLAYVPFALAHFTMGTGSGIAAGIGCGSYIGYAYVRWRERSLKCALRVTISVHAMISASLIGALFLIEYFGSRIGYLGLAVPGMGFYLLRRFVRRRRERVQRGAPMKAAIFLLFLFLPSLISAQNLPNGFKCEDLINFANGRLPPNARKPQPKDQYGAALLAYDIQMCGRLQRREITVDQFNALQAAKLRELTNEKQQANGRAEGHTRSASTVGGFNPTDRWMLWDIDDRTGKMYPVNSYSSEKECKAYAHPAGILGYTLRTCFPSDFDPRPRNELILKHTN